jgi:NAD(P)-dependent dehydrogenase (short-subunit alcohol dehydrogenase family)
MNDLRGKTAVITGAGRGIGRGIAIAYGRAGINVVVASRTKSTVEDVVDEVQRDGGVAHGITCDIGERAQVFNMVRRAAKTFGTVDILVNNAQSFAMPHKPPTEWRQPLEIYDEGDWDVHYRTGLMATLWGMKAVFPYMKRSGGKIINFGSSSGQLGTEGFAAYNVIKESIRGLTRTAAREWAQHRINVNVINPVIRTDTVAEFEKGDPELLKWMVAQIPMGRWGDPVYDAGGLALFLASRSSDYITGMTFMLDGGQFMSP